MKTTEMRAVTALNQLGWRVLRIDDQLVFDDLDGVVALIVSHACRAS